MEKSTKITKKICCMIALFSLLLNTMSVPITYGTGLDYVAEDTQGGDLDILTVSEIPVQDGDNSEWGGGIKNLDFDQIGDLDISEVDELDLAWENLNEFEISGDNAYDGVQVSVIASPETFPEQTYLDIVPIAQDQLDGIRQQIVDRDDVEIVAFDIKFLYQLNSGDVVELQPYTGKTVQVSFDYGGNEEMMDAREGDLKIYHIVAENSGEGGLENIEEGGVENSGEGGAENGGEGDGVFTRTLRKISKTWSNIDMSADSTDGGEQIMYIEATNMIEQSSGNVQEIAPTQVDIDRHILTIDAQNFSIYAIIKTNIPDTVLVHYDAGDGQFSGNVQVVDISYTLSGTDYIADAATQMPNQSGYMFDGWYTSSDCETRRDGIVDDTTSAEMTVYACYLPFGDTTYTFSGVSFTMMDRNLGAINTGDYGYYFQWGNNYGFRGSQFTPAISSDLVVLNTYDGQPRGPDNYYSSSNFISRSASPYRRESVRDDNLWGGSSAIDTDRQGPCPDGYHVPNSSEWKAVYDLYLLDGLIAQNFAVNMGLPLAGYRNANGGGMSSEGDLGRYRAATAYDGDSAYALNFTPDATTPMANNYRTYANSLRCFRDTDAVTITFDSNGGDAVSSQRFKWYEARTSALKPIPTGAGEGGFAGWYVDTGLTQEFVWTGNRYVSDDITLYAKWGCDAGYVLNASNQCVLRTVTVDYMIGDSLYKTMTYARNIKGQYLPTTTTFNIPQREGNWMFDQWYLDTGFTQLWQFPMDDDGLGENVIVYGQFLSFEEKEIDLGSGLSFVLMDRNLGAVSPSSGYTDADTDNIGYYYQYGNNYGFPNTGSWANVTNQRVTNPISTEWSRTNPYTNGLFVTVSARGNNSYTSLWGGYSANTNPDSYKLGPCPTGYHIPEYTEWKKAYDMVVTNKANYTECAGVSNSVCFAKVLGLPFGGYRSATTTDPTQGSTQYYAASSYYSYFQGYVFQMTATAGSTASWAGINAFPVRCFKNTDRYILTFDSLGGTTPATQYIWWWKPYASTSSSRYGSVFEGRYLDTGYVYAFTGYVDHSQTIYAKWSCADGFTMDENGDCVTDQYIQVTFVADPSTFPAGIFPDGTTTKTLEYKGMSAGYFAAIDEEIQVPNLEADGDTGYMFEGWYTSTDYTTASRWTGLSMSTTYTGITLYARYLPFHDKSVTWGGATFTIMDRNLGATNFSSGYSYGSSNAQNTTAMRGLFFQWGNNFGFTNNGTRPNTVYNVFVQRISDRVRGPGNYYFNGSFVRRPQSPYYRNVGSVAYENLWGGGGTTYANSINHTDQDKKGPCPDGYHIPDTREWLAARNLFQKWQLTEAGSTYCGSLHATNTGIQFCMPAALGLPFAGYRNYSSSSVSNAGSNGLYWSTTAYSADRAYSLFFYSASLSPQNGNGRSFGFSLRCFKDSPTLTLTFDSNGGSDVAPQVGFKWRQARSKPTNPTRANSTFVGRFLDSDLTEAVSRTNFHVSENTTLYAKWTCKDGFTQSIDGHRCEGASIVTFNATANGGSTSRPIASFRSGDIVSLSGFTASKPGWTFVGRNTSQTAKVAMDDFVIGSSNMTLFAIFKKDVIATFDPNGNDSQTSSGNTTADPILQSCVLRNRDTQCQVHSPIINSTNTLQVLGYSTSAANHIGMYGEDTNIAITGDIMLYAQTQTPAVDRYITFNPNGNTSFTYMGDTQTTAKDYLLCTIPAVYNGVLQSGSCTQTIIFPDITPNGDKTVLGWSSTSNSTQSLILTGQSQILTANTDLVYYAQSQSDGKNFTVTFYGNGALVDGQTSYQTGCTIDPALNGGVQKTGCEVGVPSIYRDGFTVLGYSTQQNDTVAAISPSISQITLTGDISYYVVSKKTVMAVFQKNGNDSLLQSGYMTPSTSDYVSESCTIRNSATSCTVYTPKINSINTPTVLGWSTGALNRSIVALANGTLSLSRDSIYFAQTQNDPIDLHMTFYINGNDSYTYSGTTYTGDTTQYLCQIPRTYNGELQPSSCSQSVIFPSISAPTNTPIVLGWSDGNTNHIAIYSGGQSTTVTASTNLDLFAQSTANAVSLTGNFIKSTGIETIGYTSTNCTIDAIYNGNGGESQKDYCSVQFPEFVMKIGYDTPLWTSTIGSQNAITTLSSQITGNTTFTLSASPINYDILYVLAGGTLVDPKTSYTIQDADFVLKAPTKKGYTFLGWTGSNGDVPQTSVTVSRGTYGDLDYTANRSMDKYTITYNLDGGAVSGSNPTQYTVETPNFTIINPTKTGYIFGGWTGSNIISKTFQLTIRRGTAGNLSYTALWVPAEDTPYQVYHYVKDAGLDSYTLYSTGVYTGITDDTLVLADFALDDIPCADYDRGSLSGNISGPGDVVVDTTIYPDGSTILYLYYKRRTFMVSLDKDLFTSVVEGAGTYECGQEVEIRAYPLEGYHFNIWEGQI